MSAKNYLEVIDYIVVILTLVFSLLIGAYYTFVNKKTNEVLLVGGRNMSPTPIAISLLVSYLSAITILGYPGEIYSFGSEVFWMIIVINSVISISCYVFVPMFYKLKLTSVYEYLELRFESKSVRILGAFTFIFQQLILTSVVLYAPSIVLEAFVGLPLSVSIFTIGTCGTIYTSFAGIKAVVWTDVFQYFMMLFGMIAIFLHTFISVGFVNVFEISYERGRLNFFNFTFDPFTPHNIFNFLLGTGTHAFFQTGTHQPQVQRYSSLPSLKLAKRSILLSIPLKFCTMLFFHITSLGLFALYANCDPMKLGAVKKADEILPYYVIRELGFMPGMLGLFTSCIFSAVLSSFSSALNSIVAVTWKDFFSPIERLKKLDEGKQANISRFIGVFYGIICMGLAFLAQFMGNLFAAGWKAVGPMSGALCGLFLMAIFLPFVNKYGASIGSFSSLLIMSYIGVQSFFLKATRIPLESNIDGCSQAILGNFTIKNETIYKEIIWPEKIYNLSYTMYPFFGCIIAVALGITISLFTGGFSKKERNNIKWEYLHPCLHKYYKKSPKSSNKKEIENEMISLPDLIFNKEVLL